MASVVRINITIPKELVFELEKTVPERGKSKYISTAIEEKLIRERRGKALSSLHNLPPAFSQINDSADYITKMRTADDKKRSRKHVK